MDNDPVELIGLFGEINGQKFKDITFDELKKFYEKNSRENFYKLIRTLGFYGIVFTGKLSTYSGPNEDYPAIISVDPLVKGLRMIKAIKNSHVCRLFESCNIVNVHQLNGVPLASIEKLVNNKSLVDSVICKLPVSVETVTSSFFLEFIQQVSLGRNSFEESKGLYDISSTDGERGDTDCIECLYPLSVRTRNCLKSARINSISKLTALTDKELLSIPSFGRKSLAEIRGKVGLFLASHSPVASKLDLSDDVLSKLNIKINQLKLSVRSKNCLEELGINHLWQLLVYSRQELSDIRNLGQVSVRELIGVVGVVKDLGFELGMKFENEDIEKINSFRGEKTDLDSQTVLRKLVTKISDLVLSVRASNCLKNNEIDYVWQLVQIPRKELSDFQNMGRKSVVELVDLVGDLGFNLGTKFNKEEIEKICSYAYDPVEDCSPKWFKKIVGELSVDELSYLNEKQKKIIAERTWSLCKKRSLEDIAIEFGLSRERIRQLEKNACLKIFQRYSKETREVISLLLKSEEEYGSLVSFDNIPFELDEFDPVGCNIISSMISFENDSVYFDWDYSLISFKGKEFVSVLCDKIKKSIINYVGSNLFDSSVLENSVMEVCLAYKIFLDSNYGNLVSKFCSEKKVSEVKGQLCFGRVRKIDKIGVAFKEFFPEGLYAYKNDKHLIECLKSFDSQMFNKATSRSVLARLADHPDIFLWKRGYFIHRENVSVDLNVVEKAAAWILKRFDKGISRFQVDVPFNEFKEELNAGGVPGTYALYTLLRELNNERIGQRKFPTLVDLESDIDLADGIQKELEQFFLDAGGAVAYIEVKQEFVKNRGWKEYSLQQNLSVHTDLIYPWENNTYIHSEYFDVDYEKLDQLIDALRSKLSTIHGSYSLKGARGEMRVLWEGACSNAGVRTMVKLIRSVMPEDMLIEHFFIRFNNDSSSESISSAAMVEEFFLEHDRELSRHELFEEFGNSRGWSETQIYPAINKANLFKTGTNSYVHPTTIGWGDSLSQEVYKILEGYLCQRNENDFPHMQIGDLIYEYVLPDLPQEVQWTAPLLRSIGEELGDFLFFDDAYVAQNNSFDIEDMDDMVAYLIARNFKLGIAKKEKVEELLWREGVLESGHSLPANLFFEESSIQFREESNEVELSPIGISRYAKQV